MLDYPTIKLIHITCAVLTVSLFVLRVLLDFFGRTGWRRTPLRWVPHLNDTLLLGAAVALAFIGGWNPLRYPWLAAKIVLLLGYIAAGVIALRQSLRLRPRLIAFACALLQVALIFYLAIQKPQIFH